MQYFKNVLVRFRKSDRNLKIFLLGILFVGINSGILTSSFNNYLYDIFSLGSEVRGFLELPREFPGFSVFFVFSIFYFISMKNWAVLVALFSGVGILGLGYLSPTLTLITYHTLYLIAFVVAIIAAYLFSRLKLQSQATIKKIKFIYRKEYNLYYALNVLFGVRKQMFLTFSPWVLISVFGTKPETIAMLIIIASVLGVFFRQAFGELTDRYGEAKMLKADALFMVVICLGFAFSKNVYLLYSLFIIDNLMFATRIARTTYLNKIVREKTDLAPTLSLGVTIDHLFSMTAPMVGGLLWVKYGYGSVFLATIAVAALNFFAASRIQYENDAFLRQ